MTLSTAILIDLAGLCIDQQRASRGTSGLEWMWSSRNSMLRNSMSTLLS